MLTFLRKIRKSLIESGNARKYILYAIGEIALVVIGILIALQINSWKINLENNKLEQYYLSQIVTDISSTSDDLNDAINSAKVRFKCGKNILTKLGVPSQKVEITGIDTSSLINFDDILPDDISPLSSSLYKLKLVNVMDIRSAAFVEITSSGNLAVISDSELRSEIVEFYEQLKDWAESNNFFRNAGERYVSQLELAGIGLLDMDKEEIILEKLKNSPTLISQIKSSNSWAYEQMVTYAQMKNYIDQFGDKIKERMRN